MAKSLRASSKVKARNARRYTPGSDYQVKNAARLNALSQRLMSRMKGKTEQEVAEEEEVENDEEATAVAVDAQADKDQSAPANDQEQSMDVNEDEPQQKKISTSGTRESRRETWRKARGWKPKQGTKNGGKPKRRR